MCHARAARARPVHPPPPRSRSGSPGGSTNARRCCTDRKRSRERSGSRTRVCATSISGEEIATALESDACAGLLQLQPPQPAQAAVVETKDGSIVCCVFGCKNVGERTCSTHLAGRRLGANERPPSARMVAKMTEDVAVLGASRCFEAPWLHVRRV